MPSVNNIALIGKVIGQPKLEEGQYSRYLIIKVQTEETVKAGSEYTLTAQQHTLRLYGRRVDYFHQELEPNDIIYADGSIKTIDKVKHINVRTFRLIAKRSPGDLLPPDVTLEPKGKWG